MLGLRLNKVEQPTKQAEVAPFIELLITVRKDLRAAKQFALADQLRKGLSELGITLEDRPDGTIWKYS